MTTYIPSFGPRDPIEVVVTVDDLRELIARGDFHHATYRDIGKCHEGLAIYRRNADGFRGFSLIGKFPVSDQETLREAQKIVSVYGISLVSYGNG